MRWLSFFILAYIALGLQTGLARAIEFNSAVPDFVLLAVIFLATNAPRDAAMLACFILGAFRDFTGPGTLGLFAFSYGLAGVFIASISTAVSRRHPLANFALALFAGLTVAIVLALHGWIRPPEPVVGQPIIHPPTSPLFSSALYSAILAPFVLPLLQKIRGVFHFQSRRGRI